MPSIKPSCCIGCANCNQRCPRYTAEVLTDITLCPNCYPFGGGGSQFTDTVLAAGFRICLTVTFGVPCQWQNNSFAGPGDVLYGGPGCTGTTTPSTFVSSNALRLTSDRFLRMDSGGPIFRSQPAESDPNICVEGDYTNSYTTCVTTPGSFVRGHGGSVRLTAGCDEADI